MSLPLRATALFGLLLLVATQGRSADDKMLTSDYFPLAVGTKWHYRAGEARYILEVTKHEKVGGYPCARIDMIVNKKPESHEHVTVTGDAILRVSHEGKLITPAVPFLKLAPTKDQSWKIESKIDGKTFNGVFKAGEESVKVPAGNYRTVTVSGQDLNVNGTKLNLTYYFAEKVGMVKQTMELAGQKIVVELEKYEAGR
jgi:hypothetical protein